MPPKEGTNLMDGTLYFTDENDELRPITVIHDDVELTTDTDLEDIIPEEYRLSDAYNFSFSLDKLAYKMLVKMHQNNYRRLHGLRPVRHKVRRHKPKISLFAVKRMRGGFKFK